MARIAVVIHSLTGGGSEHVAARMASWWAERGHEVSQLTLDSVDNDEISVAPSVRRIGLGLMSDSTGLLSALMANQKRVRELRKALLETNAEHIVSLTDRMNVVTLLACRGTKMHPVVCERTDIRYSLMGRPWKWLRNRTYPRARAIVVQTAAVRDLVLPIAGKAPVEVIPNCVWPLDDGAAPGELELSADRRWLAAVGRFDEQKGFDLLLDAFDLIADSHPDWNLVLIGDGPQRRDLESRIVARKLNDRVVLQGWVENPWPALSEQTDAFALPSRCEGFPNALLEAMAAGLCPVAFDCQSGPAEIIRHEANGLLVPNGDVAAFAESLNRVMSDESLRQQLANEAREVRDRFSVERYFDQWNSLLGID